MRRSVKKRRMPGRRDPAYWERLRKDRRSNAAAILGAIAALLGTIGIIAALVPGTRPESRADPLYWALLIPFVWWANELKEFSARALRFWTPAMLLACASAAVGPALSIMRDDNELFPLLNAGACICAAVSSLVLRRGSLVDREGPPR